MDSASWHFLTETRREEVSRTASDFRYKRIPIATLHAVVGVEDPIGNEPSRGEGEVVCCLSSVASETQTGQ